MIKVCIFDKNNDASRFDIFGKFFECINYKICLTCCTKQVQINAKLTVANRALNVRGVGLLPQQLGV